MNLMSRSLSFTCSSSSNILNGEVWKRVGNFLSHCSTIMDHGSWQSPLFVPLQLDIRFCDLVQDT